MTQPQIVSAARFYFQTSGAKVPIAELKNINTHVEPIEYIYNDPQGTTVHTKQYGKTKPPNVTFVTGLDQNSMLMFFGLHDKVRQGDPTGRQDMDIFLYDLSGSNVMLHYALDNAWVSKLEVGGAKAGASESITLTVTLECDQIKVGKAPSAPPVATASM